MGGVSLPANTNIHYQFYFYHQCPVTFVSMLLSLSLSQLPLAPMLLFWSVLPRLLTCNRLEAASASQLSSHCHRNHLSTSLLPCCPGSSLLLLPLPLCICYCFFSFYYHLTKSRQYHLDLMLQHLGCSTGGCLPAAHKVSWASCLYSQKSGETRMSASITAVLSCLHQSRYGPLCKWRTVFIPITGLLLGQSSLPLITGLVELAVMVANGQ
jgi:hypothetical protein